MEKQKFVSLSDIASVAMPGELIRHTSWRPGLTITTSTELLRGFGNYPHASRGRESLRGLPEIKHKGHWEFASEYPIRPNAVRRGPSNMMNGVPAHHVAYAEAY